MKDFNFDYEFVSAGAPIVTLSSLGFAFNPVCRKMLGYPDKVNIGFDEKKMALGIKKHNQSTSIRAYEFESRERNGWIRIGAKDFMNYLSIITEIDFITKAKQFIALYDEKSEMLIVMVNEDYIKK